MVEIIATVWVASFILSTTIVLGNYLAVKRKLASPRLALINANLKKINLFWMSNRADFGELSEEATEKDARSLLRSALFLEAFAVASAAGLLLVILVVVSMTYLAVSRREKATFASALATNPDLTIEQIQLLVTELRLIF